jgi:hypothetical protein
MIAVIVDACIVVVTTIVVGAAAAEAIGLVVMLDCEGADGGLKGAAPGDPRGGGGGFF